MGIEPLINNIMAQTILIIDDDDKLNQLLVDYLTDFKYDVWAETHPQNGIDKLRKISPDLVILDIMLPDMDGFEVCKTIRKTHSIPIIMLTARGDVMDKVVGLELGADDYMAKPFEPRELVARIQTVLRRTGKTEPVDIRKFGKLTIDVPRQHVTLANEPVVLTTNEFVALELLARHPGRVFDRDTILQALRGMDCEAFNRSVDITMSRLRQKLHDDPKAPVFIKTIWGAGYVFIGREDSDEG